MTWLFILSVCGGCLLWATVERKKHLRYAAITRLTAVRQIAAAEIVREKR